MERRLVLRRCRRRRRLEIVREGMRWERRRRAEGEVARGAAGAEVAAGGEAPRMVHAETKLVGAVLRDLGF